LYLANKQARNQTTKQTNHQTNIQSKNCDFTVYFGMTKLCLFKLSLENKQASNNQPTNQPNRNKQTHKQTNRKIGFIWLVALKLMKFPSNTAKSFDTLLT